MQLTASAEIHDKLERLAALMPGAELATMIEAAVTGKLELYMLYMAELDYGKEKFEQLVLDGVRTSEKRSRRSTIFVDSFSETIRKQFRVRSVLTLCAR